MIIKIFENFDEELEHLKDILVDVKDVGYWDYKMFNGENYKPSIQFNNIAVKNFDKDILKEEVKYKILFNEFDIIRGTDIVIDRLNDFLVTIGKEPVNNVEDYNNI